MHNTGVSLLRIFTRKNTGQPFFYGYYIVISSIILLAVIHGVYSSYGAFFSSLQSEFGWTRVVTSGVHSLGFAMSGLGAMVFGRLNDRFGPRRILTIGGVLFGLGYFLMSHVSGTWQLYLTYCLVISIWPSATDVILLSTTCRWFVYRRGLVSGLVKTGTGIGIMLVPLLASHLISCYGWRTAYTLLALMAMVFILPLTQVLRRDPAQKGLKPYGDDAAIQTGLGEEGFSFSEAVRLKQFWMLCAALFMVWYCANSLMVHVIPYAMDSGVPSIQAAALLSIIGGTSIVGRVVMGGTGDRTGARKAFAITFCILLAALLWLYFSTELWQLRAFVVVYGFAHGGFFGLLAPLVAELFGTRSHGALFGTVTFWGMMGGAVGPVIAGYIFDVTQSYQPVFLILIIVSSIGLALSLLLRRTVGSNTCAA